MNRRESVVQLSQFLALMVIICNKSTDIIAVIPIKIYQFKTTSLLLTLHYIAS